jgi:hypothetical protein
MSKFSSAWDKLNFLRQRQRAYQLAFSQPAGQAVLRDLAKFCRAQETCFHADPRVHAALEGRREVFLRIAKHMNLTPEQLYTLIERDLPPTTEPR